MTDKTVAMVVAETLRDLGVKHVFGVPSGGWIDYMEALRLTDGIEFVLTTHEGGAAFMADVCGRLTGAPGVCFGTFGPGATNLATGVGSALLDRSPMIALTDEMPEALRGRTVQMGIDHQALFAPLTKSSTRLNAADARDILLAAAHEALSERPGPVHIGLPVGVSAETAGNAPFIMPVIAPLPAGQREPLRQAAAQLLAARKPLLVIGLTAVRAGVAAQILQLAEQLQAPVVLTPMAKGMLSEQHPLYAGVLFHALSDVVAQTYGQADLVAAVGYDPVEFNYEQWLPAVPLLSLDAQPADIDREQYPQLVDVVGDIAVSLEFLLQQPLVECTWDLDALAGRRHAMFQRMNPQSQSQTQPQAQTEAHTQTQAQTEAQVHTHTQTFGPCAALECLRAEFPSEGIMTSDVGAHIHLIGQKWPTPAPGKQIMTNGWSAMGFAIPAAIAAKLSRPELPVCAVVGDGGFLMTAGELAVAVREQLDIVFVVFTDNDLALIRIKQEKKDNPIYGTPIRSQGTIGGDNIFGVPVLRARDEAEYVIALREAMQRPGPVIVEALLDSREYDDLVLRPNKA